MYIGWRRLERVKTIEVKWFHLRESLKEKTLQKIYVFLWFWLLILGVVTFVSLIYNCFLFATPQLRWDLFKSGSPTDL